jgi:hypothetical protein
VLFGNLEKISATGFSWSNGIAARDKRLSAFRRGKLRLICG